MTDFATVNSKLYVVVNYDPITGNPLSLKQQFYLPPSGGSLGAVKQGANIFINTDGTISAFQGPSADVTSLAVGAVGTLRTGDIKFISGNNLNIVDNGDGTFTWSASGGGGARLDQLADVKITEPVLADTLNIVSAVGANTLTVSGLAPVNLIVGDWIRGDNTANGNVSQITAITGNTITLATTTGFNFTTKIWKVSFTTLDGYGLIWDTASNAFTAQEIVQRLQANGDVGAFGSVNFVNGANTTVVRNGNLIQINSTGGGGGGVFTGAAIWTGGSSNKDAFTSPGVVNNQGITITLTASSGAGGITAATVSLNGVDLTNTYISTGAFPTYTILIPSADLTANAAEIAPIVNIAVRGTFNSANFNLTNAGALTNTQPTAFTTALTGAYALSAVAFYTTTGTLNYAYSNSAAITTFGGVFTPGGNASAASGSFPGIALTGSTISGNAIGNGLNGAGAATVNLSGTVPPVPIYTPAFSGQTLTLVPPVFSTASPQTPSAAAGSTIIYSLPSTTTSFNWICTQRPLANLFLRSSFGDTALVPDLTPPAQTISGQVFNVFGWSSLSLINPSILVIT